MTTHSDNGNGTTQASDDRKTRASGDDWTVVWDGGGTVERHTTGDGRPTLALAPAVATAPSITHSTLVVSGSVFADTDLTMTLRTTRQLRSGSPPNPWEVGWAIWHYTDHRHFYYLILKPNGWELGKADPAYPGAQRFLRTGSEPTYPVGAWHRVDVTQRGGSITVAGDGQPLATFVDRERPYLEGSIALYCEDAAVEFAAVTASRSTRITDQRTRMVREPLEPGNEESPL